MRPEEGNPLTEPNPVGAASAGVAAAVANPMFSAHADGRDEDAVATDVVRTGPPVEPTVAWTTGAPPPPRYGLRPPLTTAAGRHEVPQTG